MWYFYIDVFMSKYPQNSTASPAGSVLSMHNTKFLPVELRGILQTSSEILLSLEGIHRYPLRQPHSFLYCGHCKNSRRQQCRCQFICLWINLCVTYTQQSRRKWGLRVSVHGFNTVLDEESFTIFTAPL